MSYKMSDVLLKWWPAYLVKHGAETTEHQRKIMWALRACRTGELGQVLYKCDDCGEKHLLDCSCGNRHCPTCQGDKILKWSKRQEAKLLPGSTFLITFTIPQELRSLILYLQDKAYTVMFDCAAAVLKDMLRNPKNLGVEKIGFTSILHTWGSLLQFHPHIHILLSGGGLTNEEKWKRFKYKFAIPGQAASKVWLGKLLSEMEKIVGREKLPLDISKKGFFVDCRYTGSGQSAVRYISRYVSRVAISNSRIKKLDGDQITFQYKDKKQKCQRECTISVFEFIRRFLKHLLPAGFMKIRHYGFNHPNSKINLTFVRIKIMEFSEKLLDVIPENSKNETSTGGAKTANTCICRKCGGRLKLIYRLRFIFPMQFSSA